MMPGQNRWFRARKGWFAGFAALLLWMPASAQVQPPQKLSFRAVHYDIYALLNPADQTLAARAKVDFQATAASRQLEVELHPNLQVKSILTERGTQAPFERDNDNPLELKVTLPTPASVGQTVTLTFNYSGPLANEENSPSKGVRLAYIGKDGAYLLLPARWFPLTNFPANRYTAVFNIEVPENFAVAGTGATSAPSFVTARPLMDTGTKSAAGASPSGRGLLYKFLCDRPAPVGTFVAGTIQLTPVKAQGTEMSIYAPPAFANTANAYGDALAQMVIFYSAEFGPVPQPNLTLIQLPPGSVQGYAAPGVLLIGQREWTPRVNDILLAQLTAAQWWGDQVLPASNSDAWLSDGLSRYSAALYVEQARGQEGLRQALDNFAVGALMEEEAAPIAQAFRLEPFTPGYRSVVVNKGAMVFHMLRSALGNAAFESLLHDYYTKFSGKTASLNDFETLVGTKVPVANPAPGQPPPLNLTAFFTQWLNSTGVPEFHLEYTIYRIQKGFKVVGKVTQDLETFNMPVEVRVLTEGNPETKTIRVVGTSSEFEADTFGRPKPNGISIDPNNNLLKSSPKLRVRATIARGEELAEAGQFYEAIQQYQRALDIQKNNSLALFRLGEAMFFQKNYQAAANAFRGAAEGDLDPSYKWVEVWSHIYLGKIFDLTGQRERALNEYQKAIQTHDDTGSAQAEATRYLNQPYTGQTPTRPGNS